MGRAQAWLAAMLVVACAGAGDDGTGVTTTSTTTTSVTSEATGSTGGTPTSGQAGSSEGGSTGTASTSGSTGSSEAGGSTGSTTGAPVATTEGSEASTGAPSPVIETLRITDKNRHYVEMHGGWGPHLRGLMRAADDALWFTADRGEDVLHNREILYFRRGAGEPAWTEVGALMHVGGIQQNAASVLIGDVIYTYGVDVVAHQLEECYLIVSDPAMRACNTVLIGGVPAVLPANSNYVGAAVLGDGWRIVWWTVVGENGGPGAFHYTYNYGGGWNGPVVTGLGIYNDIGYVHAMSTSDGRLLLVGQTFTGKYPDGTYDAVVAEVTPGMAVAFVALAGPSPEVTARSSGDLWLDAATEDAHVLATTSDGGVAYYHRPPGAPWAAHVQPLHVFGDSYRARFMRVGDGPLHVVRGSASGAGVEVLRAASAGPGAVDWAAAEVFAVTSPGPGFGAPSGLYVESPTYQSAPVGAVTFAMCGQYQVSDGEVWQGTIE